MEAAEHGAESGQVTEPSSQSQSQPQSPGQTEVVQGGEQTQSAPSAADDVAETQPGHDVAMTDAQSSGNGGEEEVGGHQSRQKGAGSVSGEEDKEEGNEEEDNDLRLQNDIRAQVEGETEGEKQQKDGEEEEEQTEPAPVSTASATRADDKDNSTTENGAAAADATTTAAASQQQQQPQVTTTTDPSSAAAAPAAPSNEPSQMTAEQLSRCSIDDVPANIARIRQLLFELREPIEMSVSEFAAYWPFIDNIWVKHRPGSTRHGTQLTDYYMCRLRRPTSRSKPPKQPPADGKKPRAKAVREGGMCNVQMKIVKFEGAVTTITISRTPSSSPTHSHDLDYMDNVKRNSGLMEVIWKEAEKAYQPASIFAKFREDPAKLADVGGKFLRASDVRNVCAKWRVSNPDVPLRTHRGYHMSQGLGVTFQRHQPQGAAAATATVAGAAPPTPAPVSASVPTPQGAGLPGPAPAPDALPFPSFSLQFLDPYLPHEIAYRKYPHTTLTYASSMDSKVSLMPGVQTALSGHESKLMTHYLRSRHDAILIGVRTAMADDPGLNCRLTGAGGYGGIGRLWQPRPIIVDPTGKWQADADSRLMKTAKDGRGKAPWVVVSPGAVVPADRVTRLKSYGGDFLRIVDYNSFWRLRWEAILAALAAEGIRSVMIEGGATVISELLNPEYVAFVDSLVVTVAPTFLGKKGLSVAPDSRYDAAGKPVTALAPREVRWQPMGQDVIMCGKLRPTPPPPPPYPPAQPLQQHQQQQQPVLGAQPQASAAPAAPPILEGIEAVAKGER